MEDPFPVLGLVWIGGVGNIAGVGVNAAQSSHPVADLACSMLSFAGHTTFNFTANGSTEIHC